MAEHEKWTIVAKLNEPQAESFAKLLQALRGSHYADLCVRKDGADYWFQADWLRHAEITKEG